MDNTSTIFDESKWLSFKKNLKKNVGESAFNNWLKHLNYVSLDCLATLVSRDLVVPTAGKKNQLLDDFKLILSSKEVVNKSLSIPEDVVMDNDHPIKSEQLIGLTDENGISMGKKCS